MFPIRRINGGELIARRVGGEQFQVRLSGLRLEVKLADVGLLVVGREDNPLPIPGDIQLRVIALAGGNLPRLATRCRNLPDVHCPAAAGGEVDETAVRRPGR